MNAADSMRVAGALEKLGYTSTPKAEGADVIVLNTCVVRQSAEDKAIGRLTSLKALKEKNPQMVINLMGCLVGVGGFDALQRRYPYVDVFSQPSDPHPLVKYLTADGRERETQRRQSIEDILDADFSYALPASAAGQAVTAFLPIIFGCSHACSYCVIPLRRGKEISRPAEAILVDARSLVSQGVREITLLGQIVDRYGMDQPDSPSLSGLLRALHEIEGLERIRFLTSHPNWMRDELLYAVAELPKVVPHFELPIQAGDDQVLRNMRRGYSAEQFLHIVEKIRMRFEVASIATDLIVGFPGETAEQFERSLEALRAIRPDMTHAARYSPRPGTYSATRMEDDVPADEKMRRFRLVEALQEEITGEINKDYLGKQVEVLFEEKDRSRWRGRTRTNKIVFAESEADLRGQTLPVEITWAGPWSMIGKI